MKYILFICLSIVLLASNCNKEYPNEFYLECKVDGQTFIPDNCANCIAKDLIGDTTLILGGNRSIETFGIGIKDLSGIKTGQYSLNEVLGRKGDYKLSTSPNDRYFTDAIRTGVINISKLDRASKIIEGTFSFEAYNSVQNKVARITEGKFRLNYKTY